MYLVQARRLKLKLAGSKTFRLPTLETLDRTNRRSLVIARRRLRLASCRVVMNLNVNGQVDWTDRGVVFSLLLFAWLSVATATEFLYSPASRGPQSVYMTLASLGFLVLALVVVIFTSHGVS